MKILIINGPNINMTGIREREIYGSQTYTDLLCIIDTACRDAGADYEVYQSNHEGDIVDKIQSAYGVTDGIVINAGAYTHTSIAILDALKAVGIPTVEVHISDPAKREKFRHISYVSLSALSTVAGLGLDGYRVAIEKLREYIK